MKTPEQNRITEAFRELEELKFASFFTISLQKQFKKNKGLSEKQQALLFEIAENIKK